MPLDGRIGDLDYMPKVEEEEVWMEWQRFLLDLFRDRKYWVAFTITAEEERSVTFLSRMLNGWLVDAGFAVVERQGGRPHVHGFLALTSMESAQFASAQLRTRLRSWKGFSLVEHVRERTLWCRYVTKEVMLGDSVFLVNKDGDTPGTMEMDKTGINRSADRVRV